MLLEILLSLFRLSFIIFEIMLAIGAAIHAIIISSHNALNDKPLGPTDLYFHKLPLPRKRILWPLHIGILWFAIWLMGSIYIPVHILQWLFEDIDETKDNARTTQHRNRASVAIYQGYEYIYCQKQTPSC
ncbi:uncharacterized protein F4807DRAFT_202252 [Annulohypoxylon truncatum]|uniref:uncharacterized protein n=1 Tax=Annulohypoxylon truncatum TaxID=327061 RepID=UPI002007BC32|nr:uncharacterized protein F4807DRAFT_202252 [Annulohypoxylon truncatum]KAI1213839.1 hypothetical protein F4807DRAFT_202252 [Annulohypoxylon truncatum]